MSNDDVIKVGEVLHRKHQASTIPAAIQPEGPVIFLLDENHSSAEVIKDNITIAGTLIQEFGVTLIAVEGIEGDHLARRDFRSPDPDRCFGVSYFGEHVAQDNRFEVVGVDCHRLFKEIQRDCETKGSPAAQHPSQELRSVHMLESLLKKLKARPSVSAAILNGGTRHNDDIERVVRAEQAKDESSVRASCIRVRSRYYTAP